MAFFRKNVYIQVHNFAMDSKSTNGINWKGFTKFWFVLLKNMCTDRGQHSIGHLFQIREQSRFIMNPMSYIILVYRTVRATK